MITIEETLKIVAEAHNGQKDLDGKPVILHPLAVGLMGKTDAEIKAGFLHDVVEDTDMTLSDLQKKGVEPEVLVDLFQLEYMGYLLESLSIEKGMGRMIVYPGF